MIGLAGRLGLLRRIAATVGAVLAGGLLAATVRAAESGSHGGGESAHGLRHALTEAPLLVAFALVLGMLCQVVARHLRLPGIVVLLAVGVLVGPDVGALIDPRIVARAVEPLAAGITQREQLVLHRPATERQDVEVVQKVVRSVSSAAARRAAQDES